MIGFGVDFKGGLIGGDGAGQQIGAKGAIGAGALFL
jgi:hypothetical protein